MKLYLYSIIFAVAVSLFSCGHSGNGNSKTINEAIPVDAFEQKLSGDVQLIDVRTPGEFQQGHLKGARNYDINSDAFENQIASLDKTKPVLVYCLSGGRSGTAADILADKGFVEVYNMDGGILKWNAANKPLDDSQATGPETGMSAEDFAKLIASDKYVLVDYNATWCKPCKKMAPMLEAFAEKRKDKLQLVKIDADQNKNLLKQKGIESLPVLELYKDGKRIWVHEGEIDEPALIENTKL